MSHFQVHVQEQVSHHVVVAHRVRVLLLIVTVIQSVFSSEIAAVMSLVIAVNKVQ